MDLQQMMAAIATAFMDPLRGAIGGVADVAMPLLDSGMILTIGLSAVLAATGAVFPVGALIQTFLIIGIAMAAINFWPAAIDSTLAQIDLLGGLSGASTTEPFEVATAGAALTTLAFDHAGAMSTYMGLGIPTPTAIMLYLAGAVIFAAYLVISAISLMAWVEFWAASVILAPLAALLPIAGFSGAGFVPLSFLVSSTMRIVAIALIAAYGTDLIADFALPALDQEVTWLHAFIAVGMSIVLAFLAWQANNLVSGILMGRPGFAGGVGALKSAIVTSAGRVGGAMFGGGASGGAAGASSGGRGNPSGGGGAVGATSQPVNSRSSP